MPPRCASQARQVGTASKASDWSLPDSMNAEATLNLLTAWYRPDAAPNLVP
jgi:hypothetical protein